MTRPCKCGECAFFKNEDANVLHSRNDAYGGAYDRALLAKERRAIMEAWGEYACSCIKP